MRAATVIKMFGGAASLVGLWLTGNLVFFHTVRFWEVPLSHQIHWILVAAIAILMISRATSVRGSLEDKVQQVLVSAAVLFGAYALIILVGRLFFSRSILAAVVPATILISLGIVWFRHRHAGIRTAVIASLVKSIPTSIASADVISDPTVDFRPYDVVLVDLHEPVSGEWSRALSRAMLSGCRVRHVEDHVEDLFGAVSLEHFELEHMASTDLSSYIQIKRMLDFIGAMALLPIALPLIGISAMLVLIFSGRPAFFIQDRIGLGGQPFRMWKVRTMRPLEVGKEHQAALPGDARVTRVGRFLRRTRLDELPQLWNVLKGEMSLIGPRPEAVPFHDSYVDAYPKFAYRCLVRPGISGWAQVNAPPSATADEAAKKLTYDLYYVKHQSMALDLQIAIRTLWTVTRGSGVR
jgi:lipopolysaccharide/colanic/teichoic acid biosynthesis glycosyltransferase